MKRSEILEILTDWNFWSRDLEAGIRRENLLNRIERLSKIGEVVVISGVRRSGKSTLLLQFCKTLLEQGIRKEDILIINFEDPRFKNLDLELLNKIYDIYLTELNPQKEHYVMLDELQVIEGWEKFARYLHENRKVHVFVTGSSSKLLSSEYATVLTGRHVDMEVYPLSFSEFLGFKGVRIKSELDAVANRHKLKRFLSEYLKWGGFPKVALLESEQDKRELLNIYFRDIIIKDVVSRYKIKKIAGLEELAKHYLSNASSLQSFNKLKNILGLSLDTVERFSYYLSNVYLVSFVSKFSYSLKQQILNPKKVYCIDVGLRNSVGFIFSQDLGRLAENIVYNELKKSGKDVYYWRDVRQREVDFLLKEGKKVKELIQVCWDVDDEKTKKREVGSLMRAMEELKIKEGLILTEDFEEKERINSKMIKFVPLWKWLLKDCFS